MIKYQNAAVVSHQDVIFNHLIFFLSFSRSSISDNGVGMICMAYPHTLSRLLLALCPNMTTRKLYIYLTTYYFRLLENLVILYQSHSPIRIILSFSRWDTVSHCTVATSSTHGLWNEPMHQFEE
jgi:hypothetical protein